MKAVIQKETGGNLKKQRTFKQASLDKGPGNRKTKSPQPFTISIVKSTHNDFYDTAFSVKSIAKKKNSLLQPTAMATTRTAFNTTATPTTKIIKDSTLFGIYPE